MHLDPDEAGEYCFSVHAAIDFFPECDEVRDVELIVLPEKPSEIVEVLLTRATNQGCGLHLQDRFRGGYDDAVVRLETGLNRKQVGISRFE